MFKKSLLALALTSVAGAAAAGTLTLASGTGTGSKSATGVYTCDGLSTNAPNTICMASEIMVLGESTQTTPQEFDFNTAVGYLGDADGGLINYVPGATVPVGARVTFTLANGFFKNEDYNLVDATDSDSPVASLANVIKDADGNITAIELTVGTALASATNYTLVNAGGGAGANVAAAVNQAADTIEIEFAPGLTAGAEITISASARDNLGNISSAAAPAITLIKTAKQFVTATAAVSKKAIVDVDKLRKEFTATGSDAGTVVDKNTVNNTTLAITDNIATLDIGITVAGVKVAHSLTDSESWAGLNHNTTVTTGLTNGTKSKVDAANIVVDTTDATKATATAADGDIAYTVTLEANNDDALAERTVSMSTELDYTAVNTAFGKETFDFGSIVTFQLNGANFEVPYIPFGDNTQVIFRLTNTSTQTGDLSVRYLEEDAQDTWKDLGVIGSITPGITNVADMIVAAVKADSGLTKGKIALDVTVNAPDGTITGYVSYKVLSETDRGFIGTFK